jgi:hypothetical protein
MTKTLNTKGIYWISRDNGYRANIIFVDGRKRKYVGRYKKVEETKKHVLVRAKELGMHHYSFKSRRHRILRPSDIGWIGRKISKYNCVNWRKIHQRWQVTVTVGGKPLNGGLFKKQSFAAVRAKKIIEFAKLRIPLLGPNKPSGCKHIYQRTASHGRITGYYIDLNERTTVFCFLIPERCAPPTSQQTS